MKPYVSETLLITAFAAALFVPTLAAQSEAPIDRKAVVTRHNPEIRSVDVDAPLTVGNGGFAFGCDITGLQTFASHYQKWGVPVETQSRWCWVSDENPKGYTLADASKDFKLPDGRVLPFPTLQTSPAGEWLRQNPRSHPLGVLGLDWVKEDGTSISHEDIKSPAQSLDLWTGVVKSTYQLGGEPVGVTTACHPESDTVAVRIKSPLVANGKLRVRLAFPRGHDLDVKNTPGMDWSQPGSHQSTLEKTDSNLIRRDVRGTRYSVRIDGGVEVEFAKPHEFRISPSEGNDTLEFTTTFLRDAATAKPVAVDEVVKASAASWESFWKSGAAVDFTGSTHPLASKLEERIVLSRYLMAVQMAGDVPPQESGLTCNTWYGKHHTEMIWWHTAHFPIWGHDKFLAKNLEWYQSQLPAARTLAASRGLKGARWAKMVGPALRESPGGNPLIVWNQPHMVYLCELLYRNNPTPETLAKYSELVLETADCLATMVWLDPKRDQYVLGPPLWIAQEIYDQAASQNPSFELAYWRWALVTAQQWRERLDMPREKHWDDVLARLSPIPQNDGKYVGLESHPDTWDNINSRHDHPEMLGPLGILPGSPDVDRETMNRTLDAVLKHWDWETKIWGWDYPMIAMTAARLGRPDVAVEVLMRDGPNNRYLLTGHCPQRSDEKMTADAPPNARKREIAVYLPANGAFLAAVGLMLAGWDGSSDPYPGFAKDGKWTIRAEGLNPFP